MVKFFGALPALICAALAGAGAAAQQSGADIYMARCAGCHDAADTRAPTRDALRRMAVARIIRAMDFGTMMSVTYMLNRVERQAVAEYLGVAGEDRTPPTQAWCADRAVQVSRTPRAAWNGWSPSPTNSRFQDAPAAGIDIDNVPTLALAWAFAFDGDVNAFAAPAVIDDQLFVGSAGGSIYALRTGSGCIQWHYQADGPVRTTMVVAATDAGEDRHAVLFGDQAGGFYALDARTGELLWKRRPEAHESTKLTGTPLAHNGIVYVPVASWEESRPLNPAYECCTFRGSVVALRVADGTQVWKSWLVTDAPQVIGATADGVRRLGPSGVGIWSAPTLDAGRGLIYVTTGNNYTGKTAHSDAVVALAMATGDIQWSSQITAGDEFNLYCNLRGGCPGTDYDLGAPAILERLPDGREILIAAQKSGLVYGLDPDRAGRIVWQSRVARGGINGGVLWGMASDGQNVYAAASDLGRKPRTDALPFDARPNAVDPQTGGGLTALRIRDGSQAWYAPPSICDPAQAVCSPAQPAAVTAIPGVVFAGAVDGHLRAFATDDGRVLWDFNTAQAFTTVNGVRGNGGSIDGPGPVVAGSRLYITSGYSRNGGMPGNVLLAFAPAGQLPNSSE